VVLQRLDGLVAAAHGPKPVPAALGPEIVRTKPNPQIIQKLVGGERGGGQKIVY